MASPTTENPTGNNPEKDTTTTKNTEKAEKEENPENVVYLPRTEPALSAFKKAKHGSGVLPLALYTLVDLSPTDLEECLKLLNEDGDGNIKLATPRYSFVGKNIREVYDAHVAMFKDKGDIEPGTLDFQYEWFAILLHTNFKGRNYFVVDLDVISDESDDGDDEDDDEDDGEDGGTTKVGDGKVDTLLLDGEELHWFAPNMAIGNEDWEDYKESAEGREGESDVEVLPRVVYVDP